MNLVQILFSSLLVFSSSVGFAGGTCRASLGHVHHGRPLGTYSADLQAEVLKFDLSSGDPVEIKWLGRGAEAFVKLFAAKDGDEIQLFSRKRYDVEAKAKRDFALFEKFREMKTQGLLPDFKVAETYQQSEKDIDLEYIEGRDVSSCGRYPNGPEFAKMYQRWREGLGRIRQLWEANFSRVDGENAPQLEKFNQQKMRYAQLGSQWGNMIEGWVSVEEPSRGDAEPLFQIKAANVIFETRTGEFVLIDPM